MRLSLAYVPAPKVTSITASLLSSYFQFIQIYIEHYALCVDCASE